MRYLTQPYPFYHQGKELLKFVFLLVIIGFLFEMLIVPFPRTPSEHLYPYWIISLYHVGVAAIVYVTYFSVLSFSIKEDDWKVGNELLSVLGLLILIGVGQWAIRPIIYSNNTLSFDYLFEEVWHACLSGGLIYLLVTLVNVNFLIRKHDKESTTFRAVRDVSDEVVVYIKTQNLSDDFELRPSALICAKADGNYLAVYQKGAEGVQNELKRITLQSLGDQLLNFDFIIQTHRGYLVNVNFIEHISGNAQGYRLQVSSLDFLIPVSRKHLATFRKRMK